METKLIDMEQKKWSANFTSPLEPRTFAPAKLAKNPTVDGKSTSPVEEPRCAMGFFPCGMHGDDEGRQSPSPRDT